MIIKTSLMRGAALGVLVVMGAGALAPVQAAGSKKTVAHRHAAAHADRRGSGSSEVRELRDEVHALQARLDAQAAVQAQTQVQVQQASASAEAAQAQIQVAQDQDADATAAVLASIPTQVSTAVAAAKPKTDGIYIKGVKITLGGFAEADSIYRTRNVASDLSSPWNSIPFANSKPGHENELTFSGRQSRVTALVQGNVTPGIVLGYYGELDFQGAAQTANLNQSDSFNPRIRVMYGQVDFNDSGWHLLGGQNWSLATLNAKGITPRNEVQPMVIDSAYVPGYVYTRQPQFRITKDLLNKSLWIAVSAEEPQTLYSGTVPANVVDAIANGSSYYAGSAGTQPPVAAGGSGTSTGVTATQSLNHIPDVVAKVAYELPIDKDHTFHLEAFGLGRAFTSRVGTSEENRYAGGGGVGLLGPIIPGLFDIQASAMTGKGIGRYETSSLPDVTFRGDGRIEPIQETDFLVGGVLHPIKSVDIYSYAGEAHVGRTSYAGGFGYGYNRAANLGGCFTEGGSCSAATKYIQSIDVGFWDRIYQGDFGRAQVGVEYSYTERHAFAGANGAPIANQNTINVSFRYYPF